METLIPDDALKICYISLATCYFVIFIVVCAWLMREFTLADFVSYFFTGKSSGKKWKILAAAYISLVILWLLAPIIIIIVLLLAVKVLPLFAQAALLSYKEVIIASWLLIATILYAVFALVIIWKITR